MRQISIICALLVTACTSGLQGYVTSLSPQAGARAADDISQFVQQSLRPSEGPIIVSQPEDDKVVGPILIEDLKAAGYTIGSGRGAHHLRYAVSMLQADVLLRATIDTRAAARLYTVVGNDIQPSGPFTVVEEGS